MRFSFAPLESDPGSELKNVQADLLAVVCFDGDVTDAAAIRALDRELNGVLLKVAEEEQFSGKKGQALTLHTHGKVAATRICLVGAGKRRDFQGADLRHLLSRAVRIGAAHVRTLALVLPAVEPFGSAERVGQFVVEGALLTAYQFDKYMTGDRKKPFLLDEVKVYLPVAKEGPELAACERGAQRGTHVSRGVALARDMVNESPCEMTPTRMAAVAEQLAQQHGLELEVLGPKECRQLGMGLYLAVAQGSVEEPRFIHLTYRPAGKAPRRKVVIIGKSVTFDSGGLSIKTTEGMLDMKVDMAGGAAVLAAIGVAAALGSPDEIHAICAATENMPSGSAYKLGDVVTSMNGKTVEINNTDAEGRLTLADALTFAVQRAKPDEILDFATLTGACTIALGPNMAGVMSNDNGLCQRFLSSAREAGEDMWQLPLPERLFEQLKSNVADMKNCGERQGGCLTAGLFLKEFVGETPWVHVDIAGPVHSGKEFGFQGKGATGFAVATIVEYLVPRESA